MFSAAVCGTNLTIFCCKAEAWIINPGCDAPCRRGFVASCHHDPDLPSPGHFWAILKLFVQASKCHRNPWKSHFLPQKVPQSTIWNGSSVKWTLVDLDFAFVNDFQFSVCPSATKMNYFELHYKWLHLVLSWQIQVSLWNSFLETFQKYPMIF